MASGTADQQQAASSVAASASESSGRPCGDAEKEQQSADEHCHQRLPWLPPVGSCAVCGKPSMACGRCWQVHYCGQPHQKQDWPKHKLVCKQREWKPVEVSDDESDDLSDEWSSDSSQYDEWPGDPRYSLFGIGSDLDSDADGGESTGRPWSSDGKDSMDKEEEAADGKEAEDVDGKVLEAGADSKEVEKDADGKKLEDDIDAERDADSKQDANGKVDEGVEKGLKTVLDADGGEDADDEADDADGEEEGPLEEMNNGVAHQDVSPEAEQRPPEEDHSRSLPDELLLKVFGLLKVRSLAAASRVCLRWRRLALDDSLWRRRRVTFRTRNPKADTAWLAEVLAVAPRLKCLRVSAPKQIKLPPINSHCRLRKFTGVNLEDHLLWGYGVLALMVPYLVKVRLYLPHVLHLNLLRLMPRLRQLSIRVGETDKYRAPPLPADLRRLHVWGVQADPQLKSVGAMLKLRRLSVHSAFYDLDPVSFPVLPPPAESAEPAEPAEGGRRRVDLSQGVWTMSMHLPSDTVISLLRSRAATVWEAEIYTGSRSDSHTFDPHLGRKLGAIPFQKLRQLMLCRYPHNGGMLSHDWRSCHRQLADVAKHLRQQRPDVRVECSEGCGDHDASYYERLLARFA